LARQADPVAARELRAREKAAFLTWYYQHPACRLRARAALRADTANLTPAEVGRLARLYLVFRLEPAAAPGQGGQDASRLASL